MHTRSRGPRWATTPDRVGDKRSTAAMQKLLFGHPSIRPESSPGLLGGGCSATSGRISYFLIGFASAMADRIESMAEGARWGIRPPWPKSTDSRPVPPVGPLMLIVMSTNMQTALDLIIANPPYGGRWSLVPAVLEDGDEVVFEEPTESGLDWVQEEFDRLRDLPFAASTRGSNTRPKKSARANSFGCRLYGATQPWNHTEVSGHHWPDRDRITVTVGPRASRAKVSELLLHELCHAACPTERGAPGKNGKRKRIFHGRTFREWLVRAAEEAYGLEISPTAAGRSAYKLDAFIIAALEAEGGDWDIPVGT